MKQQSEPPRSLGGTFIRDANGALLKHIPPTRAHDVTPPKAAPAEPQPKAESNGGTSANEADSGETAPPSFAGRDQKSRKFTKE